MNVNLNINVSSVHELKECLALLSTHDVTLAASAAPAVSDKGPLETKLNELGRRIKFTEKAAATYGTREGYCAALLKEMGVSIAEPELDATESQERGATHDAGQLAEPDELLSAY